MARRTREYIVGMPYYVSLTGNNGEKCFFDDSCFNYYLGRLMNAAGLHGVSMHSYVLLPTRALILLTPERGESIPGMMKAVNASYAHFLNNSYGRTGTVWGGRYKSAAIQTEGYLLDLQKHVELLPVTEGITEHPGHYAWSSYMQNALGVVRTLKPHPEYLKLGRSLHERCTVYRTFLNTPSFRSIELSGLIASGHPAMDGGFLRMLNHTLCLNLPTRKSPGRPRRIERSTYQL